MTSLANKFASRLSQLAPFAKRADDPLGSLKKATRWLEGLPIGDPVKCQDALHNALRRFNEESTEYTKDRLPIFMLLDERSRDLQDTLVRQYLRNPRMSRQVESQLWHAAYGLYWEIARGYHTFVLHLGRDAGKGQHDDVIPLLTLRAIRAFGQLLKWRAVRYLAASEKLWLRLHNLYRIAESAGFQRRPQRAYPDEAFDCSCESAYLHILMRDVANSGTLYPRQIDLLDRWLCGWHDMLHLDEHLDPDTHVFAIDLSADHGPRHVRKPDPAKPMRFWDTAALLQRLNEVQGDLQKGRSAAELGLTEHARTTESQDLLDYLIHQWGTLAKREQRRAPRESIKRLVDVAHGLGAIVNQLNAASHPARVSPYGTGLDYHEVDDVHVYGFVTDRTRERASVINTPPSPDVERWVMHDESECGYGALVESRDKDWLRVGALIGIKSHNAEEWKLGIVRRLSRQGDDTSSVGIETLPEAPALTMLHDMSTPGYTVNGFDNSGATLPHASLWLHSTPASIILDPIHFTPGKVFQVHGSAERKLVALGSPIERCEGWMRVTVEPVSS